MPSRRATLPALVAATLALAGCGGAQPYVAARGHTVSLRLDEYRVLPERVTAPAGVVRIVARNAGRLTHNLLVVRYRRPLPEEEERVYARTATAHPGDVVALHKRLRPGRYRLICTVGNHDNLGQYGELKVLAPT